MTSDNDADTSGRDERLGDLIRSLPLPATDDEAFFARLRLHLGEAPPDPEAGRRRALRREWGHLRLPRLGRRVGWQSLAATGVAIAVGIAAVVHVSRSPDPSAGTLGFARSAGWATNSATISDARPADVLVTAQYRPATLRFDRHAPSSRRLATPGTLDHGEILVRVVVMGDHGLDSLAHRVAPSIDRWHQTNPRQVRTEQGIVVHYRLAGVWGRVRVAADVYVGASTVTDVARNLVENEIANLEFSR
jgi:hypothetical protein